MIFAGISKRIFSVYNSGTVEKRRHNDFYQILTAFSGIFNEPPQVS